MAIPNICIEIKQFIEALRACMYGIMSYIILKEIDIMNALTVTFDGFYVGY